MGKEKLHEVGEIGFQYVFPGRIELIGCCGHIINTKHIALV
jgi:hypothetical protein